ncbi:MAG: radical SAM protein [Candidatus Eisenbacteria bacterium]
MKPTSAVLAVTYRCNSRCEMCNVWKKVPGPELRPEDYRRLPDGLRNINISGGEPFLREDLVQIARVLRERYPSASVVISTNGLLPDRIETDVRRMGRVGVRVSIDAVGRLHDEVRGVNGAFSLAMETVTRLKALGVQDLGISATLSERTAADVVELRKIADARGVQLVTNLVHSSPIYFGEHGERIPRGTVLETQLGRLVDRELGSRRPKDWFRAYMTDGIIDQLRGRERRIKCGACKYFFFMEPNGDVYPCNMWPEKLGNILVESYDDMTGRAGRILGEIDRCNAKCWMSCTVAPAMRRRPVGPALWVLKRKIAGRGRTA